MKYALTDSPSPPAHPEMSNRQRVPAKIAGCVYNPVWVETPFVLIDDDDLPPFQKRVYLVGIDVRRLCPPLPVNPRVGVEENNV